jgi:hypothetical protein
MVSLAEVGFLSMRPIRIGENKSQIKLNVGFQSDLLIGFPFGRIFTSDFDKQWPY